MNKFIALLLIITSFSCTNLEEQTTKRVSSSIVEVSSKPIFEFDKVIHRPNGIFEKERLLQFHIYHDGEICGYANCIFKYKRKDFSELDSVKIIDIYNPKGLINSVTLEQTETICEFNISVSVGRNSHKRTFLHSPIGEIRIAADDELSIEAIKNKNSGIRIAKDTNPPFLAVRVVKF